MSNLVASLFARPAFQQHQVPELSNRVYVITGGSNGIGLAASRTLFKHGAKVVVLSSQAQIGAEAVAYVKSGNLDDAPQAYKEGFGAQRDNSANGATKDGSVEHKVVDLGDLKAVAALGKELSSLPRLDGFLGIAGLGVKSFELTADGYDRHLTVNALSHLLLLSHLLPLLEKTSTTYPDSDVRVVLEASEMHRFTFGGPSEKYGGSKFADEQEFKEDVGPQNLYARTKLANILLVKGLVYRLSPSSKVLAYSTHPGAVATGQQEQIVDAYGKVAGAVANVLRGGFRAPDDGVLSVLYAATAPELREGKFPNATYFSDPAEDGKPTSEGTDEELRDNFWKTGLEIIKKVVGVENAGSFA